MGDGTGTVGKGLHLAYYNGSYFYNGLSLLNTGTGYGNLQLMKDGCNVGIGTANPGGKLDIVNTNTIRLEPLNYAAAGLTAGAWIQGRGATTTIMGDGMGTSGNGLNLAYYNGTYFYNGLSLMNISSGTQICPSHSFILSPGFCSLLIPIEKTIN